MTSKAILSLLVSLAFESVVLASEHEAAAEHHGFPLKGFIWATLNFVILVGVLVWKTKKPLADFLVARRTQLEQAIQKSSQEESSAREEYEKLSKLIASIDSEKKKIIDEAHHQIEVFKETAKKEFLKDKNNLENEFQQSIQAEVFKASGALKAELVKELLLMVRNEVNLRQGSGVHQKLTQEIVKELR